MPAPFTRQTVTERALARLGTTVQQKYRIDRLLGIGGTAAVYSATHRNGHRVAIKFLLDHLLDDTDIYHLFSREAYVANRVGHPGAVPVLDDDEDNDGCVFLIMPLIEGETLRARWERSNKRLPIAEVGVFLADVLEVLDAAHAKGVVHRDIKPENLFVTLAAEMRVLDFGIARRTGGDTTLTMTGRFIGTPAFMPPEQALGNRQAIGPRSDLWAVGATMFSLLTGEPVHLAETSGGQLAAAATKHARPVGSVGPEVPSPIARVIDKALEFDVRDRWPSAQAMHDALLGALEETLGEKADVIAARLRATIEEDFASKAGERAAAEARAIADQEKDLRSGPARRTPKRGADLDAESDSGSNTDRTLPEGKEQISDRRVRDAAAVRDSGNEATLKPGSPLPKDRTVVPEASQQALPADSENETPPVVRGDAAGSELPRSADGSPEGDDGKIDIRKAMARRRGFLARATPWLVVIGLAAVGGASTMRRCGGVGGGFTANFAAAPGFTPSLNAEANAAFEAGVQLWRDAACGSARKKFADAAHRDPGLALAHLYFVAASEWLDSDARIHFAEAQSLRGRLSSAQAALLDALEPSMAVPARYAETTTRLKAFTKQYPDDSIGWTVLGAHAVRTRDPATLLAIAEHIPGAIVHWFRARAALEQRDDVEGARKSLDACTAAAPRGAIDCLITRARIEANEGMCDASALAAKRLIEVDHTSPDGYAFLARAEFGRSHRTSAVRAILEQKYIRVPEEGRELERQRDEFFLAVLDGEFDRADTALDSWLKSSVNLTNMRLRARPLQTRVDLNLELGRTEAAQQAARTYVETSETWLQDEYYDGALDNAKLLYRTGLIGHEEFLQQRAAAEQALVARGGPYATPGVRWIAAYAFGVVTKEDAQIAVAQEPPDVPYFDAEAREVNTDVAMGRTYLYTDQLDKALKSLRRATNSCLYWRPLDSMAAHTLYGDALVKSARREQACDEYKYVLERWGRETRSNSVRAARESALRLGCPGIPENSQRNKK